jgi:hypothetical protein
MEVEDGLRGQERRTRGRDHGLLQEVARLEQAREVDKPELDVPIGTDAEYRSSTGLRLGADNGERFTDDGIQERRFAGVGPASERDRRETGGGVSGHLSQR